MWQNWQKTADFVNLLKKSLMENFSVSVPCFLILLRRILDLPLQRSYFWRYSFGLTFVTARGFSLFFSLLDKDSIYKICILSGLFCCFDLLYLEIFTWFSERRQWPWCCISRLFQFLLSGFVCCCLLDTVSLEFLFVPLVIWCGLKIFFFFNCLQFFGLWASCTCFIQM